MGDQSVYEPASGPLKQGDILIAPITRVAASDFFTPNKWGHLDQTEHTSSRSQPGEVNLHLLSGQALVMVTSHDCHHDKEWNAQRNRLIRSGVDPEEAEIIAESDPTLDRTFQASPIVPLKSFDASSLGNYRAGRVTGFYPLPAPSDGSFPECVVDLTYRCTIDRKAISDRRWCLSATARARLRYAIARFDSFRTVDPTEAIEAAVGKLISDVLVDSADALTIEFTLDDGSVLKLVQPPIEPDPSGRSRM